LPEKAHYEGNYALSDMQKKADSMGEKLSSFFERI
jgi:hypothetical protein